MLRVFHTLVWIHIVSGSFGILAFWFTAFLAKGTWLHVRLGKIFCISMLSLSISGFGMSALVLQSPDLIHPSTSPREALTLSAFLSYLGFCSIVTVINGVIHQRSRINPRLRRALILLMLNGLALALGGVCLGYGFSTDQPLFAGLSLVGISIGGGYFWALRKPSPWKIEHLSSMMGGGVALHTGLIAGGGARFMPLWVTDLGIWAWIIPSILGGIITTYWTRKYREP